MKAEEYGSEMLLAWKFDETELFSCLELQDTVFKEGHVSSASCSPTSTKGKPVPRHKRQSHINAELKRRGKIKTGFHDLEVLVPTIDCKADSKSTKLNKGADYCRKLQNDKKSLQQQVILLKNEVELLTHQICECQMQLPSCGVRNEVKLPNNAEPTAFSKMYDDHVKKQTKENWKYWIFSKIMRPMFDSFVQSVDTHKPVDLVEQGIKWADGHCDLKALRKDAFMALRNISKSTSIITHPERLQDEVLQAVCGETSPKPNEVSESSVCSYAQLVQHDDKDSYEAVFPSPSTMSDLIGDDFLGFSTDFLS